MNLNRLEVSPQSVLKFMVKHQDQVRRAIREEMHYPRKMTRRSFRYYDILDDHLQAGLKRETLNLELSSNANLKEATELLHDFISAMGKLSSGTKLTFTLAHTSNPNKIEAQIAL